MERSPLTVLGQAIADAEEASCDHRVDFEAGRARLLRTLQESSHRSGSRQRTRVTVAILAAAAILSGVFFLAIPPRELSFDVAGTKGSVGAWIAAPPSAEVPVTFSDGTRLTLSSASRARVVEVESASARILVERGRVQAEVVHHRKGLWHVDVGPFGVLVTGTRFALNWDPEAELFTLSLTEGSVQVSGPLVGAGRAVNPGEELRVSLKQNRMEIVGPATAHQAPAPDPHPSADPAPPEPPAAGPTDDPRTAGGRAARPPSASAAVAASPSEEPSFRKLAGEGKYKEALSAAEHAGFDGLCQSASAADLMILANAARLGGSAARARQALQALRDRFPTSREGSMATYQLGTMSSGREAAGWFSRYLSENPGGPLVREASGRLIEARKTAGDTAGARAAARDYLARYPKGPHAALAKSLVEDTP